MNHSGKDSHSLAAANDAKNAKFSAAFGINGEYTAGDAFNKVDFILNSIIAI